MFRLCFGCKWCLWVDNVRKCIDVIQHQVNEVTCRCFECCLVRSCLMEFIHCSSLCVWMLYRLLTKRKHSLWPTAPLQWQRALLAEEPVSRCFGLHRLVALAVFFSSMYTATAAEPVQQRRALSAHTCRKPVVKFSLHTQSSIQNMAYCRLSFRLWKYLQHTIGKLVAMRRSN